MTDRTSLNAEAERRFARWIAGLNGWAYVDTFSGAGNDAEVAANWITDGRAEYATRNRAQVVQLTDAGWAWCRTNGAA